jgi:molybdate-binding protein/DNA-binding XRE family transcriptional regulator
MPVVSNRVRAAREARGWSQGALAEHVRLSRQSVGAIEAGRAVPAVDVALRIATALERSVEDLFGAVQVAELEAEPLAPAASGRVALARVGTRWISYPLDGHGVRTRADGLARGPSVELLQPAAECRDNLVLMGCAPALGLLADRLNVARGPGRFFWLSSSSTAALEAFAGGKTHVAGVHLVDPRTGQENVADVRRHARTDVALVTLARWEEGFVTAPGNPKKIRRARDLARRSLRLVIREKGSGARRLLDRELRAAGVETRPALGASGHLEVAHAVAIGAADAGIATRDAAIAFGLDFVPLAEERYDLVVSRDDLGDPRVERLFEALASNAFRRELDCLGYDVRPCGERVDDLVVA